MSLFTRSTKRTGAGPEPGVTEPEAVTPDAAGVDVVGADVAGADQWEGSGPRGARLVFTLGVVAVMAMFLDGAWQRRWIADDGLIVLRTVRNLLAGNGPVFNIDERVETNTSAAWTYVVYGCGWLTQMRLEYVVLTLALTLSLFAVALAMAGTARLYFAGPGARRTGGYLLPAGVLIYIALPPARDYATSGLETCLVIFWIALVWLLLVWWATSERPGVASTLGIAFVIGLAPMIRPEMVLVGLPCLAVLFEVLGLGLPVSEPSLGMLIANGFQYMLSGRYWISIYPGIALIVLIVAINLVGDQIRDQLNPRLKR